MTENDKRKLVSAFMDAWERADAGAVMRLMSEDCIYSASVGPEPGKTYRNFAQVTKGVGEMLTFEAGGESRQGQVWFAEDRAFAEWDYDDIQDNGEVKVVRGLDIIHMESGKIRSIDAYRKTTG
ncbi:MAG: nuclear transport factor 2 family protein [Pseudomonadota bacterium]